MRKAKHRKKRDPNVAVERIKLITALLGLLTAIIKLLTED